MVRGAAACTCSLTAARAWIYMLMVVMLISGTAHTLLMKLLVRTKVPMGPTMEAMPFAHPFTQTLFMLFGETVCLVTYYLKRRSAEEQKQASNFPKVVMAVPAIFDILASSLVHASFIFTPASIVQMCKSANLLFVFLLSIIWLKKRPFAYHIWGVALVFLGIVLVALGALFSSHEAAEGKNRAYWGVPLCLGAQIFHALQNVIEEKFLKEYSIPAQMAVGLEGVFGSLICIVILLIMNPLHGAHTIGALYQMHHSGILTASVIIGIACTALFNWSGLSITQDASAIARATIDGARTIFVWILELSFHWHTFQWLQLVGFLCVATGTVLYNRIIEVKSVFYYPSPGEDSRLIAAVEKKDKTLIPAVEKGSESSAA